MTERGSAKMACASTAAGQWRRVPSGRPPLQQPVFHAELGGADGVFRRVIVEAGLPVLQMGRQRHPLVEQVLAGQAEPRLGQHVLTQAERGSPQPIQPGCPLGLAQGRTLGRIVYPGFIPASFVGIKTADELHHKARLLGPFLQGFEKLPARVRPAGHPSHAVMSTLVGRVGCVAVGLQESAIVVAD